jgi:hypothetical protein
MVNCSLRGPRSCLWLGLVWLIYPLLSMRTPKMHQLTFEETAGPQCPLAARKNVGLFSPTSQSGFRDNFQDVILLVACNYAYYDMLQNWEYLANQLNLQWAVLALDDELYNVLGPEKAISPGSFSVTGPQSFRRGEFNKLSCNKMRMVMSIAENCGMDIVFSDVDNIFYHNPFEHDFGRLIESRRYDYVYQPNDGAPNTPLQDECLKGKPRDEANTGFYYLNRKSATMKRVVNATLEKCSEPSNRIDDQTLFWKQFWKFNKTSYKKGEIFHHCDVDEYVDPFTHNMRASNEAVFNFCCLDPYHYPVGRLDPPRSNDPITYHANFVSGKEGKVNKLRNSRSDGYGYNESRISL